jgi:nitrogen regulatory protein PII
MSNPTARAKQVDGETGPSLPTQNGTEGSTSLPTRRAGSGGHVRSNGRVRRIRSDDSAMNLIVAIIRPSKLDEVKEALTAISTLGMTVTEAKGFGRSGGQSRVYQGALYTVDFSSQVRIEVLVPAAEVDQAVAAILASARTGKVGDGQLLVLPVAQVFRIRTGETGMEALGVGLHVSS